jgi:hypothetical protein
MNRWMVQAIAIALVVILGLALIAGFLQPS